jgi:drug/metabolite transporter (DMT)-like permease
LLAYALAFMLTIRILSVHAFGQAVPVFIALPFVFSLLAARWVFQESVSWQQLGGVFLILAGVTLVAWRFFWVGGQDFSSQIIATQHHASMTDRASQPTTPWSKAGISNF